MALRIFALMYGKRTENLNRSTYNYMRAVRYLGCGLIQLSVNNLIGFDKPKATHSLDTVE